MRLLRFLPLLLAAACGSDAREGAEAWREGRAREAFEAFRRAASDRRAPGALLGNLALSALVAGEWGEAERAAERMAESEEDLAPLRDFLLGNVAFARSLAAEKAADRPGAPPSLRERAAADAEDALARWRSAARSREDWPEARRNVERALLRLERLRGRKEDPGAPPPPPPPPEGIPEGTEPGERKEEAPPIESDELPPERVAALLEMLRERDREKLAVRKAWREAVSAGVERDW